MIDIKIIKIEGTQSRASLNNEVMNEYAESMRCGAKFPPIKLFFDGSDYWLADGFHRYFACKAAEIEAIDADIETGSKDDAILYSIGANTNHGLQRTSADKRNAVMMILNHPIWREWSNRTVAKEVSVSLDLVNRLRNESNSKNIPKVNESFTTPTPVLEVASENSKKEPVQEKKESTKVIENNQLSVKPSPKIEEETYSEIDKLRDENLELKSIIKDLTYQITIANYEGAEPIEDIIKELKITNANLKQITISRNAIQNELNAAKRQIIAQRKELNKLKK